MSLRYQKICQRPTTFLRLFGLSSRQFERVMQALKPLWHKHLSKYKRPGRFFKLELGDMLLMVLLYYRTYITQRFIGYLFGIDDSRVCRIIKMLEPLLAKVMALPKKELSQDEALELILDATESPIERPQHQQKRYYSGKKKRHTLKTEVRIQLEGKIIHVSKTHPGSVHDFALYKKEPPLPRGVKTYGDSGYQGLDKIHPETEIPFKASKNKPLDREDKIYNRALARIRVKVENILGQIKTFKILVDRYRNKRKRYNLKFKIIAGIVNMKNGFHLMT